jgi:hypothetical protein
VEHDAQEARKTLHERLHHQQAAKKRATTNFIEAAQKKLKKP